MKVDIYVKGHLRHLIPTFPDWITQRIKKVMCLCLEILNVFY